MDSYSVHSDQFFKLPGYEKARNSIINHTCQILHISDKKLKPYASGVCVLIHNEYYILTASHVARPILESRDDFVIRVNRDHFVKVLGKIVFTDENKSNGLDVGYIKLLGESKEHLKLSYDFVDIKRFLHHPKMETIHPYVVCGYPEGLTDIGDEVRTGLYYYLTRPLKTKVFKYYKKDPNSWYIVNLVGTKGDMFTDQKIILKDNLHGLSGCGLWKIKIIQQGNKDEYIYDYRLIGIMTDYRRGKFLCLMGIKIKHFLDAMIKNENVKFSVGASRL